MDLLAAVCDRFPALRLRLSSIHPNEVNAELLQLLTDRDTMRHHLHISLQSGSDGVLKRMKRPYGSERAWRAISDAAACQRSCRQPARRRLAAR